ncbi:hypothetical protein BAXH7_00015 [Bacillus amyloliquefaciens XH7]|nr:hypothetical protein BAXH7_00015 [Bacillus amyloliquefaciens XH7]
MFCPLHLMQRIFYMQKSDFLFWGKSLYYFYFFLFSLIT